MNSKCSSHLLLIMLAGMLVISVFLQRQEKEVKHIVAFKFKSNVLPIQIEEVNREFKALQKKIPGIISVEIGTNFEEDNLSKEFSHTYMLTFETKSDKDAFIPHPERMKLNSFLNNLDVIEKSFIMAYAPL